MKSATLVSAIAVLTATMIGAFSCRVRQALKEPQRTLIEDISVRRSFAGNYQFDLQPAGHWAIFSGPGPDRINWSEPVAEVDGDFLSLPAPKAEQRAFFGVVSPAADTVVVSERQIPMVGQVNFRDLGGLPAAQGRYVKWGLLYRSGNLASLTDSDLRYFKDLDIRTVIDLRNDLEISKDPDRLPKGVNYFQDPISDKEGQGYSKLRHMVLKEGYRREKAKELFVGVMATFADSLAADAQPIFDILTNENATPLLYHCTGGKDRTGFVTALILSSLGVERNLIMQDYLMSNYYRREINLKNMKRARLIGLDQETLEYALQVRKEYLQAVFEVMDEYGGTDAYLETKFGLTEEKRRHLQERFTTPYFGRENDEASQLEPAKEADKEKKKVD